MACSLRRYGVTDSGFSIAVTTTRLIQGVLHACLQFILPFSIGIKMLRNYFIFALMSISCSVSATCQSSVTPPLPCSPFGTRAMRCGVSV
ncbi:MAG: hypothetical protein P8X74_05295 [Reinekea sp.]